MSIVNTIVGSIVGSVAGAEEPDNAILTEDCAFLLTESLEYLEAE